MELGYGLIISGALGSGKSSLARAMSEKVPLRLLRSVVTRSLEPGEDAEYISMDRPTFIAKAREREIVFPFHFGGTWYGYTAEDWSEVVQTQGARFIFNVRPYVALILANLLRRARCVWIDLPEDMRLTRLAARAAKRDNEPRVLVNEDLAYAPLFSFSVVNADFGTALNRLIQIHRGD